MLRPRDPNHLPHRMLVVTRVAMTHQVLAMKNAKWEIASHGLKWIEYKDATPTQEKNDLLEAITN